MNYIVKYSRIIVALILAFGISNLIFTHQYLTPLEFNVLRLKEDAQSIVTSIASVHFELPKMKLFSQKIVPTATPADIPIAVAPTMEYEAGPTEIPTSTPSLLPSPTPSIPRSIPTPLSYSSPTKTPPRLSPTRYTLPPTKTPKPTKAPDVFPIDPSLARPGKTVDEMIKIAAQKACIPAYVLRGIASRESGGFFTTVSPKYALLYNSYNWWNSEYITDATRVCSGYAFDGNTGNIFADSKFAGYHCPNRGGVGPSIGVMQAQVREYNLYKADAARALGVKNVDLRVILDSLVIAGIAIQREVHATSCSNWTSDQMIMGACRYHGSCDGYCPGFCESAKAAGGPNCSGSIGKAGLCY